MLDADNDRRSFSMPILDPFSAYKLCRTSSIELLKIHITSDSTKHLKQHCLNNKAVIHGIVTTGKLINSGRAFNRCYCAGCLYFYKIFDKINFFYLSLVRFFFILEFL